MPGNDQRYALPPQVCELCGRTFTPMVWNKHETRRFCSRECSGHANRGGHGSNHNPTPDEIAEQCKAIRAARGRRGTS